MKTHKDLDVWNKSINLVSEVYAITEKFPKSEMFGLTNQIRRASVSVPANISEGAARNTSKDYLRFLRISQGSLSELETLFIISTNLRFLDTVTYIKLQKEISMIGAQLSGLIHAIERKTQQGSS